MLAKDHQLRPTAEMVYEALVPLAAGPRPGNDEIRDATRPFRRPLLAAPRTRPKSAYGEMTDAEVVQLKANVRILLDNDRPLEAIRLLEEAVERAGRDAVLALQLRHLLGAALFYTREFTRAAALFDAIRRDYRRHLPQTDEYVLDCAYHAGHAYAAIGKPDMALPQLRFYVREL